MTGNEWLNIQDIFALFLGPWIALYLGAAVAGSVGLTLISIIWRRVAKVQIVRADDEE